MKSQIARISINTSKCPKPMLCKICLEICPEQVLQVLPMGIVRGVEYSFDDAQKYWLRAEWMDRCIGCMECVNECPQNAIAIEFPEVKVPSKQEKQKQMDINHPDFVLDFRKYGEQKKYFELGGMTDKLKHAEVLYIIDEGDMGWIKKRLTMLRPGRFTVIEAETKEEGVEKLIVHRALTLGGK